MCLHLGSERRHLISKVSATNNFEETIMEAAGLVRPSRTFHGWFVQDANFAGLLERPQLWIADGWYARFNMPLDPKDYGCGHGHTRAQWKRSLLPPNRFCSIISTPSALKPRAISRRYRALI